MNENHKYLFVGHGRLARHLKYYFDTLNIRYLEWRRNSPIPFEETASSCETVLLPINDDAIIPFIDSHEILKFKTVVHFSGILSTKKAEGFHPLMTFPQEVYSADFYPKIYFICEKGRLSFPEIFPELPNPYLTINAEDKSFYHAWLTMSGNFTTFIWQSMFERLAEIGIPKHAALPYFQKTAENLAKTGNVLTGPFVRGDINTIEKHKEALANDAFQNLYNIIYEIMKREL